MISSRWPEWVYGEGEEPDYRWSFANERTYLAWIRTALALVAAAIALHALPLLPAGPTRSAVTVVVLLLGIVCAGASWWRWAVAERAMRRREPLPALVLSLPLTVLVCGATVVVLALTL